MYPNQFNDYQGMMQIMAFRELLGMRKKAKEEQSEERADEDRQALMHLIYSCLGKVGLLLSRCGKGVASIGQRLVWFAMSKKMENAPWHYH